MPFTGRGGSSPPSDTDFIDTGSVVSGVFDFGRRSSSGPVYWRANVSSESADPAQRPYSAKAATMTRILSTC